MILRKVNREEKNEIEIVYNMDDAPFVLRYEQEIIQINNAFL